MNQKKQKFKAADILLKSVCIPLKGLKLASLRQSPLLNAPFRLISLRKISEAGPLSLGFAIAIGERVAFASLGFWEIQSFASLGFYPDFYSVNTHQGKINTLRNFYPDWSVACTWQSIFNEWIGYVVYKVVGYC
ncbi:hypothetical protein [uncultured Bacteroides sp.]|uniref:hypothetical protein n=1 Tax=uncultured Bacteroides sp. TaxID=162156 RepID=UPI002AAAF132|nr:hypothetical protein [uncultured Bacteroides sp.]